MVSIPEPNSLSGLSAFRRCSKESTWTRWWFTGTSIGGEPPLCIELLANIRARRVRHFRVEVSRF